MTGVHIGELDYGHRDRLQDILHATHAFRDDEVAVALELFDESCGPTDGVRLGTRNGPADYEFIGAFTSDGGLAGYACYGPTPSTDRTYDLYWIAVHPMHQGSGGGSRLLDEVERRLQDREARLLVVETSARTSYAQTRHFYEGRGYRAHARLRDFYAPGDDRVIYAKGLMNPHPSERGARGYE